MGKEITEMTLEELWQLFPIKLTAHNKNWVAYYYEIKSVLEEILTIYPNKRISHIGSTAINGIWAKPIIDVLLEVCADENPDKIAKLLEQNAFTRMCTAQARISLNQGYTKQGFANKVYHIHIRCLGDNDELYFRDYLNEFPDIAEQYEQLKLKLWKQYEYNRDAYTLAKAEFINKYTQLAKDEYKNKYRAISYR